MHNIQAQGFIAYFINFLIAYQISVYLHKLGFLIFGKILINSLIFLSMYVFIQTTQPWAEYQLYI